MMGKKWQHLVGLGVTEVTPGSNMVVEMEWLKYWLLQSANSIVNWFEVCIQNWQKVAKTAQTFGWLCKMIPKIFTNLYQIAESFIISFKDQTF